MFNTQGHTYKNQFEISCTVDFVKCSFELTNFKKILFFIIVDYFVYCCSKKVALWLQYQCTWCDRLDSKSKTAVDSLHQPHRRLMTGVYPQGGAVSAWSKTWEQVYGRDRSPPSTNKMSAILFSLWRQNVDSLRFYFRPFRDEKTLYVFL